MKASLVIATGILVYVAGCQTTAPSPTATHKPAETLRPTLTATIVAASTPTPTHTPIPPTATIQSPSLLSNYLTEVRIVGIDNLDTIDGWHTYNPQTGVLAGGVYTITGQPGWQSGLVRNKNLGEGQGVMFDFKYDRRTEFEFIFETGAWETDLYRRFGVFGFGYPQANLTQGRNAIGYRSLTGNFQPRPDTWYNYMAGIGFEGDFIALIWDPSDPSKVITYKETIGEKWNNQEWKFTVKAANIGMNLYLDNVAEISFSSIK